MKSQVAIQREKRLANLTAQAALSGVSLVESTDDRGRTVYVASRWAHTKQLNSLDEVEQWIGRVAGSTVTAQQIPVAAEADA
jgi:hypothetical protein